MTTKGYIQTRVQNSDDLDNIADWQNLINTIARHRELFTVSELEGMMAVIDHNVCDDLRPLLCKKYRSLNGFHLEECDCSESRVFLKTTNEDVPPEDLADVSHSFNELEFVIFVMSMYVLFITLAQVLYF